jgi:predicted GIY-YIG superfamily endonuclease
MDENFWYVYMLQSIGHAERFYVGLTKSLSDRLRSHNAGRCSHTRKFAPWRIETAIAFRDKSKAVAFEKYLKSHSGRAFAVKHL